MSAELLASTAVVLYALAQIAAKRGTAHGRLISGFILSLAVGTATTGGAALVTTEYWLAGWKAVTVFAAAGVVGAGVGRILILRAIRDAGASVAAPISAASRAVVATVAAFVILHEDVPAERIAALGLVLGGLWCCARGGTSNRNGTADRSLRGLLGLLVWPVGAGTALALADLLRKSGLLLGGTAIQGAFVGAAAALVAWLLLSTSRKRTAWATPHWGWYGLHGLLTALGLLLMLSALNRGDLSVIALIVAAEPIVLILLARLMLRGHEVVRRGTVVGAGLAFIGLAMSTLLGT